MTDCRLCGKPTMMEGTGLCHGCWELDTRVRQNPDLTKKILASMPVEEASLDQDLYIQYIDEKVNPERVKHGLKPIDKEEARRCYDILNRFYAQWRPVC